MDMAAPEKKKAMSADEERLAGMSLDEVLPSREERQRKAGFEEPAAFGAFEAPQAVGGEEFRIELGERPRIRERIVDSWAEPLDYERGGEAEEDAFTGLLNRLLPRLSLTEHKRAILAGFAVIYLVFVGMLTYLFFFNSGLAFEKGGGEGPSALLLKNVSQHVANDVVVSFQAESGETVKVGEWKQLLPGEGQPIEVAKLPRQKSIELMATARYHQGVNARLSLEKLERETKLRSSFRAPTVAFVDESFEIKAEVCNEALDEEVINVRESHDARVFKEEARGYALELAGQQCAEIVVPFTPKAAAKTTILFNLISRDNSEKQQIRLEVRE